MVALVAVRPGGEIDLEVVGALVLHAIRSDVDINLVPPHRFHPRFARGSETKNGILHNLTVFLVKKSYQAGVGAFVVHLQHTGRSFGRQVIELAGRHAEIQRVRGQHHLARIRGMNPFGVVPGERTGDPIDGGVAGGSGGATSSILVDNMKFVVNKTETEEYAYGTKLITPIAMQ